MASTGTGPVGGDRSERRRGLAASHGIHRRGVGGGLAHHKRLIANRSRYSFVQALVSCEILKPLAVFDGVVDTVDAIVRSCPLKQRCFAGESSRGICGQMVCYRFLRPAVPPKGTECAPTTTNCDSLRIRKQARPGTLSCKWPQMMCLATGLHRPRVGGTTTGSYGRPLLNLYRTANSGLHRHGGGGGLAHNKRLITDRSQYILHAARD